MVDSTFEDRTNLVNWATNTPASSYNVVENAVADMEIDYTFREIVYTIGMSDYTFMGAVYNIGEGKVLVEVASKLDKQ